MQEEVLQGWQGHRCKTQLWERRSASRQKMIT
jgi:hypothetical protein